MRVILGNMGVMRIPKRILPRCLLVIRSIGKSDASTRRHTNDSSKCKQFAFSWFVLTVMKAAIECECIHLHTSSRCSGAYYGTS